MRNLLGLSHVALITITAPGVDAGLPWDREHCSHGPEQNCSGTHGCRVYPPAATAWNNSAAERRSQLHRAVSERVRRELGGGPIIGAKATEMQQRGVLHYHLVVDYRPGRARARIDAYVRHLKELAPLYLFGFVDIRKAFDGNGGIRAAAYCAKYIGKATAPVLEESRPMYVGQHLTRASGVTMRWCRYKRYAWWATSKLQVLPQMPDPEAIAHGLVAGQTMAELMTAAFDVDLPPPLGDYAPQAA